MHSFQISGLQEQEFSEFFDLTDAELAKHHMQRVIADSNPGYPYRVSLVDAEIGEELLLLPHAHLPEASPYQASGPIFVRRHGRRQILAAGVLSGYVTTRLISLRAYSANHRMLLADVCAGDTLSTNILHAFDDPETAYLHLHNAKRGCYSCRVDRVRRGEGSAHLSSGN